MQLYYFKDPAGNFGDDLNAWLWPQLIPELLDDNPDELLVGIGTLLNHRLPDGPTKHVLGSGVGYGDLPDAGDEFVFHAVRGHKSARALGVPRDKVITDAGVLVRDASVPAPTASRVKVSLMLTGQSLHNYDWRAVCERAEVNFISCHWSVPRVLREIQRSDLLLTEAMHGAIVADALRVPWVPVTCSDVVLGFKWEDWLSSLSLEYRPQTITPLVDLARHQGPRDQVKHMVKRMVQRTGHYPDHWTPPVPRRSGRKDVDAAIRELLAASRRPGMLSNERLLDNHVRRFREVLAELPRAAEQCTA